MVSVREVLNRIKWSGDLAAVEVWFVHRGAPNDIKMITGGNICRVGVSFLEVDGAMIPHHRIFRIVYQGRVVFERPAKK